MSCSSEPAVQEEVQIEVLDKSVSFQKNDSRFLDLFTKFYHFSFLCKHLRNVPYILYVDKRYFRVVISQYTLVLKLELLSHLLNRLNVKENNMDLR